jgi:hypothetical protein
MVSVTRPVHTASYSVAALAGLRLLLPRAGS